MAGLTLWPRVRAVAYSFQNFTELPPGSNRGQVVDRFTNWTGYPLDGVPWCACYVSYCGWWGLYDPVSGKSAWPFQRTGGCPELAHQARAANVLMAEPQAGDFFLLHYAKLDRFAHTGWLVAQNPDGSWKTLEGNTSKPGDLNPATQREGWGVFERSRRFGGNDRFGRWSALV